MAQQVKVLADRPESLSLIRSSHPAEKDRQAVLWPPSGGLVSMRTQKLNQHMTITYLLTNQCVESARPQTELDMQTGSE